jgi:DNA-binding transcriptional MerR regulator
VRIDELERRARVKRRTIRHYFDVGLLERPTNHGWKTEYSDEHLLRLTAIRVMRFERGMSAHDVRAALARMKKAELEALVGRPAPAPPAQAAKPAAAAPVEAPVDPKGAKRGSGSCSCRGSSSGCAPTRARS